MCMPVADLSKRIGLTVCVSDRVPVCMFACRHRKQGARRPVWLSAKLTVDLPSSLSAMSGTLRYGWPVSQLHVCICAC